MADRKYVVVSHTTQHVVLKQAGIHLFDSGVTIPRASIASVSSRLGQAHLATSDGRSYTILPGIKREQRALTNEALGTSF